MLLQAFNDPQYLEQVTGLDKMKEETEAMLDDVEWGSDDDEEIGN
jgi:ubiquitin-like modifier-activating enzyme ATG7